jgi:hypothetical protein
MSENLEEFEVIENAPDHHYRTEIPNIVFELGLDPYELCLYIFLKKVAGDYGKCWHSSKKMADACGMKETKLKECKKRLSEKFNILNDQPLIKITERKKIDGSNSSNLIEITPIWRANGDYFRSKGGGSRNDLGGGRSTTRGGSPNDYKEDPMYQYPIEQQQQTREKSVVVVSQSQELERQEIMDLLTPYGFDYEVLISFAEMSIDDIRNSILAYEQYLQKLSEKGDEADNRIGILRRSIENKWKPNKPKTDKHKQKELNKEKQEKLKDENYQKANKLYEEYKIHFTKKCNFSINSSSISLRYGERYAPISISDENCISYLEYYIEQNFEKQFKSFND